jgi:hypothetical protein
VQSFNCSRIACIWNRFPRPGGHQRNGWPVGRFAASLNNAGCQNGLAPASFKGVMSVVPDSSKADLQRNPDEGAESGHRTSSPRELWHGVPVRATARNQ